MAFKGTRSDLVLLETLCTHRSWMLAIVIRHQRRFHASPSVVIHHQTPPPSQTYPAATISYISENPNTETSADHISLPLILFFPLSFTTTHPSHSPDYLPSFQYFAPQTATKSSSRPLPLGLHHDIPSLPFTRVPLDSTSTSGPPPPYPRQGLKRRRSSYPPTQVPSHTESFPFNFEADTTKLGGKEMAWPAEPSWESLLNFTPGSPRDDPFENKNIFKMNSDAGPSARALSGNKIAQMGEEMAWKTILGTVVEVEAVGGVPVAKLLQEIWKRGGGDAVSLLLVGYTMLTSRSRINASGLPSSYPCPLATRLKNVYPTQPPIPH